MMVSNLEDQRALLTDIAKNTGELQKFINDPETYAAGRNVNLDPEIIQIVRNKVLADGRLGREINKTVARDFGFVSSAVHSVSSAAHSAAHSVSSAADSATDAATDSASSAVNSATSAISPGNHLKMVSESMANNNAAMYGEQGFSLIRIEAFAAN